MIITGPLNFKVCEQMYNDIQEYITLYKHELDMFQKGQPTEPYHDDEYFVEFKKSLRSAEKLMNGYAEQHKISWFRNTSLCQESL